MSSLIIVTHCLYPYPTKTIYSDVGFVQKFSSLLLSSGCNPVVCTDGGGADNDAVSLLFKDKSVALPVED